MQHLHSAWRARARAWTTLVCAALLGWGGGAAQAAGYPERPVQFVIGFAAGGATDINGRLIAKTMGEQLKQPFVVENKLGAAGSIGVAYVTAARPDGYLIGMSGLGSTVIQPILGKKLGYDPENDLTPVAFLGSSSMAFITRPGSPIRSIEDLVKAAKDKPGQLSYGTAGNGTPGHLAGAYLSSMAGIAITQIPYKGDAELLPDLMSGRLDFAVVGTVSVFSMLKTDKLHGIALTSRDRLKTLPAVRTVGESGQPGYEAETWNLLIVPKGTPAEIGHKLNATVNGITGDPAFQDKLVELGSQTRSMPPEELKRFVKSEREKWTRVIRDGKITVD